MGGKQSWNLSMLKIGNTTTQGISTLFIATIDPMQIEKINEINNLAGIDINVSHNYYRFDNSYFVLKSSLIIGPNMEID